MRMWTIEPKHLCRKHLLGEHVEMHMLVGTIKAGKSISGYISKGLLNPTNIRTRHDLLAQEMKIRGYQHNSPMEFESTNLPEINIDDKKGIGELLARCSDCRSRYHHTQNTEQ